MLEKKKIVLLYWIIVEKKFDYIFFNLLFDDVIVIKLFATENKDLIGLSINDNNFF